MGPKLKKPAKNAFSFFLDEYVEEMREKGRHISHKIGAEECAPLWRDMDNSEKEKFNKLAAVYKEYSKADKRNKFTTSGISYAELERQQDELRLKTEKADTEIKVTISNLDSELWEIPLGYAFEAKQTIEEIHSLPYPPYEAGDSDYFGILDKILTFLEPGKLPDGRYPPLYTIENNIKASENILQALSDSKCDNKNHFRVFLLPKMFFWLKNKCVEYLDEENVGFPVMSNAESEITKDVFCYTPGISCSFHMNSEEKYQNCSLSVVQRLAYVICDHCCQHLGVDLIPGKHCRLRCDTDRRETRNRIEKERMKKLAAAASSEVDFDGRSSFADDVSSFDWRKDRGGGSFLHDEIASTFSGFDISSAASTTRRAASPPFNIVQSRRRRPKGRGEDMDTDDDLRRMPLGRGSGYF